MVAFFRHHISVFALAAVLSDLLLSFIGILLADWTVNEATGYTWQTRPGLVALIQIALAFAILTSLSAACFGIYRRTKTGVGSKIARNLLALMVGGYIAYRVLDLAFEPDYSIQLIVTALAYLMAGLLVTRTGVRLLRRWAGPYRVLVVGTGKEARLLVKELKTLTRRNCEIVGFYPTTPDADRRGLSRVFGRDESIVDLVARHEVREVIVAVNEQRGGGVPMDQLLACRTFGVPVLDLAGFYERSKSEVPIDSLKASWLVYGSGFVQGRVRRFVKRSFDLVGSSVLLMLALPVMLVAMLLIYLDQPGPVLYRQERVGYRGRIFMCLKLRSMRRDAEADGIARWASLDDERVTRIGRFLRKTRIDELPQLISVLRGEMSLVGPRPERPSFVKELTEQIPFYAVRHSIKPGLTGWAQVRYNYGASLEDARRKHQFDLYYLKNNSLFLDLLILIETVSVVLFREGQ